VVENLAPQGVAAPDAACEMLSMKHAWSLAFGALLTAAAFVAGPTFFDRLGPSVAQAATPSPRAAAAQQAFKLHEAALQGGGSSAEDVYTWSRRWLDAERATNGSAAKDHLTRMKSLDAAVQKSVSAGSATRADGAACAFYVAEAKELAGSP